MEGKPQVSAVVLLLYTDSPPCCVNRSTDMTGQCHARAAGGPSWDRTFHPDSDASAFATAATVLRPLMATRPLSLPRPIRSPWTVLTAVRTGPALWTTWTMWRLAGWRTWRRNRCFRGRFLSGKHTLEKMRLSHDQCFFYFLDCYLSCGVGRWSLQENLQLHNVLTPLLLQARLS